MLKVEATDSSAGRVDGFLSLFVFFSFFVFFLDCSRNVMVLACASRAAAAVVAPLLFFGCVLKVHVIVFGACVSYTVRHSICFNKVPIRLVEFEREACDRGEQRASALATVR